MTIHYKKELKERNDSSFRNEKGRNNDSMKSDDMDLRSISQPSFTVDHLYLIQSSFV